MAKDPHNDPKKPNVKALVRFMLAGNPVEKGEVVSKKDFPNAGDWKNLCNMEPARAEETADAVGKPKAEKPAKEPTKAPG